VENTFTGEGAERLNHWLGKGKKWLLSQNLKPLGGPLKKKKSGGKEVKKFGDPFHIENRGFFP